MKCMQINKRPFWFAEYIRREEVKDEYGNVVGYKSIYDKPIQSKANFSPARGQTESMIFGSSESYDRVLVADRSMPFLKETTVLWIDTTPELKPDGFTDTPHDYIVKKVADSLNGFLYAVKKVDVSA